MRTRQQIANSSLHNERKAKVFIFLVKAKKYYTTVQLSKELSISKNNMSAEMMRISGQGYVWRAKIDGMYRYQHLKPMGSRVAMELWIRLEMQKQTEDPRIVLNLKKKIPYEYNKLYQDLKFEYIIWKG